MNDKPDRMPNVPPFVKFVASAVPMVFDNSLSYYEALCALWKYIQGMTDVINNNATLEEEYIEKFNELKTFVDEYFDNLDVQEEINNKLDQMAEDGTLQEIITTYIQSNVAWTFDNVADMQAATNLVNGSFAQTLGFNAIGDGGGALYKITDTGTADNLNVFACGDLFASNVNLGVKKISLAELPQVGAGVYTLGRVTVNSAVNLPRQNNRGIIIVDTVFDINTSVLFPAYTDNGYFILPSFVGCTFNNLTDGRVLVTSGSNDSVASRITGCNFMDVDMVANTGYVQDYNFTNCYIQSHTCFIDHDSTTTQVRFVNCTTESECKQLINAEILDGYFSGTYEGNVSQDNYLIECNRGIITMESCWLENSKFIDIAGGASATQYSVINVNGCIISGYTDTTPNITVTDGTYVVLNINGSNFGAYSQNSRFTNLTPAQFMKVHGKFDMAESYAKPLGGYTGAEYELATLNDINSLENKHFISQELRFTSEVVSAGTGIDVTLPTGTYLCILGYGAYGAIEKSLTYLVSVSNTTNNAYAAKLINITSDLLNNTTLTMSKASASDTTFTLKFTPPSAYTAELCMIRIS